MIHSLKSFFSRIGGKGLNPGCLSIFTQLFNEAYYLENNQDVAKSKINPFDHYLKKGFKQRRLPCAESEIADAVIRASKNQKYVASVLKYMDASDKERFETFSGEKLVLPYHTKGNFFFKEIAQHIVEAAIEVGVDAVLINEKQFKELQACDELHCFLVAPQEFFYLGRKERLHKHTKNFMPAVTYLLAEQPQTVFFLSQLEYIFDDVRVVDMNFHVATYLRSLGVNCHYLPLGWIKSLKAEEKRHFGESSENMYLPKDGRDNNDLSINTRSLDAVFIGNGCERRQAFFADNAEKLCHFKMAVFMPDWKVPHEIGGLATLDADDSVALCQRSKIFLNIHRDNFEYFEWHRICMRGFMSGAMVLTEPVFKVPEFESGVHYLECSLEEMPEKIDWLLNSDEGKADLSRIALAGKTAYLETSMTKFLSSYLSFIQRNKI